MLSATLSNILLKVKRTWVAFLLATFWHAQRHLSVKTVAHIFTLGYIGHILHFAFTPHILNRHTYARVFTNPKIYVHQNRLKLTEPRALVILQSEFPQFEPWRPFYTWIYFDTPVSKVSQLQISRPKQIYNLVIHLRIPSINYEV